ncbi:MAG: class E sortase [Acidimicrobiales bacterium]
MQFWSAVGAIGRLMMRVGVVILLFVAFQLWGTGLSTARAQDKLTKEFDTQIAEFAENSPTPSTTAPEVAPTKQSAATAPPNQPVPQLGDPIARLTMKAIDSDFIIVQGVDLKWLQEGPGHFPQTPLPGQPGNAAIAGHRTTYQAPFNRIDELVPGDTITVATLQGTFTYIVDAQSDPKDGARTGYKIISPNDMSILDQESGTNRLTLMACHPKFSAAQRIVVTATLDSNPAPATPIPTYEGVTSDASLDALAGGDSSAWPGAILWSLLTAAAWFGVWWLARFWTPSLQRTNAAPVSGLKDWRFLATYAIGTPVVLVLMFIDFTTITRLLPASY